jgi:molecular chaperone HtpG
MSEKKEFKAESKRLLDLMINSIYTHKEIFLRELISNASDAIDKYYYYCLENKQTPEELKIRVDLDEENRTLTISDDGIGMTQEELEENLGTIAKSGSLAFKEELNKKENENKDIDIIGQFGVGFYSAFMVASEVQVTTKSVKSDQAYCWTSDGASGYTIEPCEKEGHGTSIKLILKADDDMENYSEYLNSWKIQELVKKYSDYIRYPILMDVETQKMVEGTEENETPEYESVKEEKTLNSMVPLWKRAKSDISEEEFAQFYKEHFYDWENPLKTIYFNIEGNLNFTALLYIPSRVPQGFYSTEYKPGLQLYSRNVFIMDHCEELLPPYLRFVQGLVDSQDLSLNISREMLQHDRQLTLIRNRIEKKVLGELAKMLTSERETYEKFWANFGLDIKFGVYNNYGQDKDKLENLLLFYSSKEKKLVTLNEYVDRMPEVQKDIYYVTGQNVDLIAKMPIVKKLEEKGYEILFLTAEVDEFVMQTLGKFRDHSFKNASQGDLNLDSEEEKEELAKQNEANKDLLTFMKDSLDGEVNEVRLSNRLVDDPVTLVAGDGLSFEMEKVYQAMAAQSGEENFSGIKATRILEINPNNKIFNTLSEAYAAGNKEKVKEIAEVLYDQALLIEGFKIKDPIEYSKKVVALLTE